MENIIGIKILQECIYFKGTACEHKHNHNNNNNKNNKMPVMMMIETCLGIPWKDKQCGSRRIAAENMAMGIILLAY